MSTQTIGVNLRFNADTTMAKKAMVDLQTQLQKVASSSIQGTTVGKVYTADLNQASQAANRLRIQLQNAFNVNTGKLNLTKLNAEMQQSGMSLQKYRAQLMAVGPEGQKAFSQLAQSIATAEASTVQLGAGVRRLGATFANTLRYQMSSALIMGFISSVREAVNYVKDLNASLTDIRIVTGYNIDRMKEFAVEANKAAKALSTTTNEYTKASLIYFQQGLTDEEVKKRTDLTVKMANVTGEAVKEVSDQLTAVWNNFYDGTKSLEHYVDVMVALGAATASSSKEIAEGLEKFAAVSETVGLSYEYAASALATVTATTRQSADVVGTAFKTLFARVQDLELGKTVDDGTTLGKYSQALAAVGINIKDVNGDVKDMNIILDEMGAKWDYLTKSQQVALAQNVAGVRQYTQLVALMDNWDYFQENLNTSMNSSGTLQKQADTYAESWEAASNRVKASLETIYSKVFDDQFFIKATDAIADFIGFIDNLVDALGGVQGVLSLLGAALMKVFSTQVANGINTVVQGFRSMTASGRQANIAMQQQALQMTKTSYGTTGSGGQMSAISEKQTSLQLDFVRNKEKMLTLDKQIFEIAIKDLEIQKESIFKEMEENKILESRLRTTQKLQQVSAETLSKRMGFGNQKMQEGQETDKGYGYLEGSKTITARKGSYLQLDSQQRDRAYADLQRSSASQQIYHSIGIDRAKVFDPITINSGTANTQEYKKALDELQGKLKGLGVTADGVSDQMKDIVGPELAGKYQELARAAESASSQIDKLDLNTQEGRQAAEGLVGAITKVNGQILAEAQGMENASQSALRLSGENQQLIQTTVEVGSAQGVAQGNMAAYGQQAEATGEKIRNAKTKVSDFGSVISSTAQMMMSVSMAISTLRGVLDTINNDDMTFWEKLLSITTSLSMVLPMLIMSMQAMQNIEWKSIGVKVLSAAATMGQAEAERANNRQMRESIVIRGKQMVTETADSIKDGARGVKRGFSGIRTRWNNSALDAATKNGTMLQDGEYFVAQDKSGKLIDFNSSAEAGKYAGKTALKGLGMKALSFATTAAAIAAVIAAGKAIYDAADEAYNRDEKAAQRAEEAAKNLANAHGKATEKLSKLTSGMKEYNESLEGLKKLKQGTEEYSEAIESANEKSLELINTYDSLAGQYQTTADGLIVFNEGALENAKILEKQNKNAMLAASTFANREAAIARNKADTTNFLRKDIKQTKGTEEWSEEDKAITKKGVGIGLASVGTVGAIVGGVKLGGSLGALAGPVGAAIGAVVGAAVGVIGGAITAAIDKKEATEKEKTAIEALQKAYNKMGNAALTKENMTAILKTQGINDPKLVEALQDNSKELEKLLAEVKANTEARKAENENLARQIYSTNDTQFTSYDSYTQQAIASIGGEYITKLQDKIDYTGKGKDKLVKGWNVGTEKGKEAFETWAEAQGLTNYKIKNFKGTKEGVKYKALNEETGKYETKTVSYETLAAAQEGKEVAKKAEEQQEKITSLINKIGDKKGSEGLLTALGGVDINNITLQQLEDMKDVFASGQYTQVFEELGTLTGENYIKKIEEAIANWDEDTALNNYLQRIKSDRAQIFSSGAETTGVSAQALENYSDALMKNSKALNGNGKTLSQWDKAANSKTAAQMAVASAKATKGVVALGEALGDNIDVLEEWNEESLMTWESVAKVQEALKQVFGLKVSADFIKKNLVELQELANGNTESLELLRQEATRDFILNLSISDEQKQGLLTSINGLIDEVSGKDIEFGVNINDASYLETLNAMLESGKVTSEEVQAMFAGIGYAVDIGTTTKTTTTTNQFAMEGPNGERWDGSYEVKTTTEIPYIKTANSSNQSTGGKTDRGNGVTIGNKEKGSGITFTGTPELAGLDKENKKRKDEIDRYYKINEELERINENLDNISKQKERAFGNKKLALIDAEIAKQQELIDKEKEHLKIVKDYLNQDAQKIWDLGFITDEKGTITNYQEMMEHYASISDEKFSEVKSLVDQYNETLDKFYKQQQVIIDKENDKFDMRLNEVTEDLEHNLGLIEDDVALLEFQLEQLVDPIDAAADAIIRLGEKTSQAESKIEHYRKALVDSLSLNNSGITLESLLSDNPPQNLDLTADQVNKLREYRDAILESTQTLSEMGDTVHEKVRAAFEAMNEEMDRYGEKIEHNNSLLEHYRNVVDLVGKDALGISDEIMKNITDAQASGALNAVEVAKSTFDMNKAALEKARDEFDTLNAQNKLSDADKKRWQDTINTLEDEFSESENALADAFENALQTAADIFEKAVEDTTKTFKDAMAGLAGSADDMQRKFDQQKDASSRYLADYQKIYELSKLSRELDASMDDTDSIRGKQRLRDLQEEILAMQESGAEVTQYEVDELRARYDLRLAEIALEEAQNAKSQVRMSRDAEGNWGYVYTADEKAVGEAEQAYEDKLYAYQKLTQDYIDEAESNLTAIPGEMADAIAELDRAAYASEEEYLGAIDEIREFYAGKYEYYANNMNKALENSSIFYDNDWKAYSEKTGYKMSLDQNWRDQFNETTYSQVTGYQTADAALAAFNTNATSYLETLGQAYSDWYTTVNTAFTNSGISMDEYAKMIAKKTEKIRGETDATAKKADEMAGAHTTAFEKIVSEAGKWSKDYSLKIDAWVKENERLAFSINGILQSYQAIVDEADNIKSAFDKINGKNEPKEPEKTEKALKVQQYLNTHFQSGLDVDGVYGSATKTAAKKAFGMDLSEDEAYNLITDGSFLIKENGDGTYNAQDIKKVFATDQIADEYEMSAEGQKKVSLGYKIIKASDLGKIIEAPSRPNLYYTGLKDPKSTIKVYSYKANGATGTPIFSTYHSDIGGAKSVYDSLLVKGQQVLEEKNGYVKLKYNWNGNVVEGWFKKTDINLSSSQMSFGHSDNAGTSVGVSNGMGGGGGGGYAIYDPTLIKSLNTGGYTGSWGESGRLALLHQKELVLNASDTENFLSAVNILRDITSVIDLNAAAQYGHLKSAYSAAIAHPTQQTVEQEVTIHAEFPNATNHSEIEEAFNQLLNHASQFANRKN